MAMKSLFLILGLIGAPPERPYGGLPTIPGLEVIHVPQVAVTRLSGVEPLAVQVHAAGTRAGFSDGGASFKARYGREFDAYSDLEFFWDFGDKDGAEKLTNPATGAPVDANTDQVGPHAAYVYRKPGRYIITLQVRGKNEGGFHVENSSSVLKVEEYQQVSIRQAPRGGTYTISWGEGTTAPIAWNARNDEVQAALEAIPALGSGNVQVLGGPQPSHSRPFHVYFTGTQAGIDQPLLTVNVSALTVPEGAVPAKAIVRDEINGATAPEIVVEAFSGPERYFDSSYVDNPADGVLGSQARPMSTWADLRIWMATGGEGLPTTGRRTWLKRGSSWTADSSLYFEGGRDGARVQAYGEGPRPIIRRASGDVFAWRTFYESPTVGPNRDFVVDGLELETQGYTLSGVYTTNGDSARIFGQPRHFLFADCVLRGGTSFAQDVDDVLWWRDEFTKSKDSGYIPGINLNTAGIRWMAALGCRFSGGGKRLQNGIPNLDHHWYSTQQSFTMGRWLDFDLSDAQNYCFNGNAAPITNGAPKLGPYHLFDGCDFEGTQNGLDFSTTNNSPTGSYLDRIIVQGSNIHIGQVGNQGYGVLANNPALITLRDNRWYGNKSADVVFGGLLRWATIYRNKSWRRSGYFLRVGAGTGGWVCDNQFVNLLEPNQNPTGLMAVYPGMTKGWKVDWNEYYAPDRPDGTFWDSTAGKPMPLASWAHLGFDRGSVNRASPFPWVDPQHGDFSVPIPLPPPIPLPDDGPIRKRYRVKVPGVGTFEVDVQEIPR
jgi:hypothetical protein